MRPTAADNNASTPPSTPSPASPTPCLRGIRQSGRTFAAPTYAFIAVVLSMLGLGLVKIVFGDGVTAESAAYPVHGADLTGFALLFLVLRAFASGCTALTGVEAISNGVPFFRKPRSRNAAVTLEDLLGGIRHRRQWVGAEDRQRETLGKRGMPRSIGIQRTTDDDTLG